MVIISHVTSQTIQLVLTPNRSLDWVGNLWILVMVGLSSMVAALPLIAIGGWVVIPFVLLQWCMLAVALYLTLKKLSYKEVITVDRDKLSLQCGARDLDINQVFNRSSVNILVEQHAKPMMLPDIDLVADGRCYSLGEFLNRDDRLELTKALKKQLNLRISHLNSFHRVSF